VNGSGFGTTKAIVDISGIAVPSTSITSWTSSVIKLTVPSTALSGRVVVLVNKYPSNRLNLTVNGSTGGTTGGSTGGTTGGTGGTATVTGLVQSSSGTPLAGASISLDSGQSTTSAADGTFTISGVPP